MTTSPSFDVPQTSLDTASEFSALITEGTAAATREGIKITTEITIANAPIKAAGQKKNEITS